MHSKKPIVFWCRRTGLANRLRALPGYQALSHITGVPFLLCWEANYECDVAFNQLFETGENIPLISVPEKDRLAVNGLVELFEATPNFDSIWTSHLSDKIAWEAYRDIALGFLRGLRPLPHIREQVSTFVAQHGLGDALGLHIRMTDNLTAYDYWTHHVPNFDPQRISRLEGFSQFVRDRLTSNADQRFFLATDNRDVERVFVHDFPGSTLVYPKKYRSQTVTHFSLRRLRFVPREQRVSPIDVALVELLLLSNCKAVAGTYFSSYGEFAAILGGIKHYIVTGETYEENLFAARLGNCLPAYK